MEYKCKNHECEAYDKIVLVSKLKMVYNKHTDRVEPKEAPWCKTCGSEMEYVHPEVQEISVNVTTFSSLTPQEKRQMIHKRSVDHFKKTDKGDLANTKKQIMNDIRSRVEGRKI